MKNKIEKIKKKYYESQKIFNYIYGFFEFDGRIYHIKRPFFSNYEEEKKEIIQLANDGEDDCLGFLILRTNGNWEFKQGGF